jgi:hypothetical protein
MSYNEILLRVGVYDNFGLSGSQRKIKKVKALDKTSTIHSDTIVPELEDFIFSRG